MTTIGTWLVLVAGKQCERGKGEPGKRRFGMLIVGLAFGAIAFVTSDFLLVDLGSAGKLMRGPPDFVKDLYNSTGEPRLTAFLAYFGALFMTIGWRKLCDPLRSSRLHCSLLPADLEARPPLPPQLRLRAGLHPHHRRRSRRSTRMR